MPSNNIQSQFGINHWIPFTEDEVKAREKFASNFMSQFIRGKLKTEKPADLFDFLPTDTCHSREGGNLKKQEGKIPAFAGMTQEGAGMTSKAVDGKNRTTQLTFSAEAQAVFDAGRALYTYYHQSFSANTPHPNPPPQGGRGYNTNASLYDIREHFQGRNAAGRMNSSSEDETYSFLIKKLRDALKALQKAIEPKIYAYEFLK